MQVSLSVKLKGQDYVFGYRAGSPSGTTSDSNFEEFAAYCAAEFERRQNSGEEFDEAAYREAMEMALTRLRQLEEEGLA